MVVPLILTAQAAETLTKGIQAMGTAAQTTVFSTTYLPTIRRRDPKTHKIIEVPNPHYPRGIEIAVPAWFMLVVAIFGGATAMFMFTDIARWLGIKAGNEKDSGFYGNGVKAQFETDPGGAISQGVQDFMDPYGAWHKTQQQKNAENYDKAKKQKEQEAQQKQGQLAGNKK